MVICSSDYRKSQKSKQIVKQLMYGRKTKTAPNKPADSL